MSVIGAEKKSLNALKSSVGKLFVTLLYDIVHDLSCSIPV